MTDIRLENSTNLERTRDTIRTLRAEIKRLHSIIRALEADKAVSDANFDRIVALLQQAQRLQDAAKDLAEVSRHSR